MKDKFEIEPVYWEPIVVDPSVVKAFTCFRWWQLIQTWYTDYFYQDGMPHIWPYKYFDASMRFSILRAEIKFNVLEIEIWSESMLKYAKTH